MTVKLVIVHSSIVLGGKAMCIGALEQVGFESKPELISADGW